MSRISRSRWRSSSSAFLSSVTSLLTPKIPMARPPASRHGSFELRSQPARPSANPTFSSLPRMGSPVRMIRRSSSRACRAYSGEKKSKSVLPIRSAVAGLPTILAIASLQRVNRDSGSLK